MERVTWRFKVCNACVNKHVYVYMYAVLCICTCVFIFTIFARLFVFIFVFKSIFVLSTQSNYVYLLVFHSASTYRCSSYRSTVKSAARACILYTFIHRTTTANMMANYGTRFPRWLQHNTPHICFKMSLVIIEVYAYEMAALQVSEARSQLHSSYSKPFCGSEAL